MNDVVLGVSSTRRGILGLLGSVAVAVAAVGIPVAEVAAKKKKPKKKNPFKKVRVTAAENGGARRFSGTLSIANFAFDEATNAVVAVGAIQGFVSGPGMARQAVRQNVRLPLSSINGVAPTGSSGTMNIQAASSKAIRLAIATVVILLLGVNFTLAAFGISALLLGTPLQKNIVAQIFEHRDFPGGALSGLAFWLGKLVKSY